MAKIKFKDVTSISFDGQQFDADKDGFVEVPDNAICELLSHGLAFEDVSAEQSNAGDSDKQALLDEALALGIKAAKTWGVAKLQEAIEAAKAQAAEQSNAGGE